MILWIFLVLILISLCCFVNPSMKDFGKYRKQFMGIAFFLFLISLCSPNYIEFTTCTHDPVSKTDYCTIYAVGLWGVCHYQDGASEGCYTISHENGQPGKLYQCKSGPSEKWCLLGMSSALFFGILQVFTSLAFFYLQSPSRKYRASWLCGILGTGIIGVLLGFYDSPPYSFAFYAQIAATCLSFWTQALTWASLKTNQVKVEDQTGVIGVALVPNQR